MARIFFLMATFVFINFCASPFYENEEGGKNDTLITEKTEDSAKDDNQEIIIERSKNCSGRIISLTNIKEGQPRVYVANKNEVNAEKILVKDKLYVFNNSELSFYFSRSNSNIFEVTTVKVVIEDSLENPNYDFIRIGNPEGKKVLILVGRDVGMRMLDSSALIISEGRPILNDPNIILEERWSPVVFNREKIAPQTHEIFFYMPKTKEGLDSCLNDLSCEEPIEILIFSFHGNKKAISVPNRESESYHVCDIFYWPSEFQKRISEKFSRNCSSYMLSCETAMENEENRNNNFAEALSRQLNIPIYASSEKVLTNFSGTHAGGLFYLIEPNSYNDSLPCIDVIEIDIDTAIDGKITIP